MNLFQHERQEGLKGRGSLPFVSLVSFVLLVLGAVPASAEIVFFNTGRTLSVKTHRVDGDSVVLSLRNGGEIVCESSLIARFAPDEVPYPEPEPPQAEVVAQAPDAGGVPYAEII